jgi:adenylate kinase
MDTNQTVFFVGKPGSGKGTQATLLAKKTGWPAFASGDIFRGIATENSPVGRKVKSEIDAGKLVPHWFPMYLYLKAVFSIQEGQSAIFDGFNRKVQEAELVVESLKWLGRPFKIVHIKVSDETVHTRLANRSKTSGRADDHFVGERLREYYTHTEPAIKLFEEAGVLIDIDGEQPVEAIQAAVEKAIGLA